MFNYYKGEGVDYWMSERAVKFCATHRHKFYEAELIIGGGGSEYINGVKYDVGRGSLTIMPPDAFHSYCDLKTSLTLSTFCFNGSFLSAEIRRRLDGAKLPWLFRLDDKGTEQMTRRLKELKEAMAENSPDRDAVVRRLIELILLRLQPSDNIVKSELTPDDEQIRMLRVILNYVDEHYAERINRDELAESFHYSASYFSSLFRKLSGTTLSEHIANVRMDKAMELVIDTELPVAEIVKRAGYRSESLFYRLFNERFGKTPLEVRALKKR